MFRHRYAGLLGGCTLIAALFSVIPTFGFAQSGSGPTSDSPAAAVEEMLRLLEHREFDNAYSLGEHLVRQYADEAAINALFVIAYSNYGGEVEAVELAERQVARWPNEAWAHTALAAVLQPNRLQDALDAAARARALDPDNPAILALLGGVYGTGGRQREFIAAADSFIAVGRAPLDLRVRRINHRISLADSAVPRDTAGYRLALEELAALREEFPYSPLGYLFAGERALRDRRTDAALPLLRRASELAPQSSWIAANYWRTFELRSDLTPSEKVEALTREATAHAATRAGAVAAQYLAASALQRLGDATFADEFVQRYPESWQSGQLMFDRASQLSTGEAELDTKQHYQNVLRELVRRPGLNRGTAAAARGELLFSLLYSPHPDPEELWSLHEQIDSIIGPQYAFFRYTTLPVELAKRGVRVAEAEILVLDGLAVAEMQVEQRRAVLSVERYARNLGVQQQAAYSSLGWIRLYSGDLESARRYFLDAREADSSFPEDVFGLGQVAEAEGNPEEAERWYALGLTLEGTRLDYHENRNALQRLYRQTQSSFDGFEEYIKRIEERDRQTRKARILSQRIEDARNLPALDLRWLNSDQRAFGDMLDGKIGVIHFWGVWCGPCVREMPEIQRFWDAYREHSDIVFLTISNDANPQTTRDFMRDRGFDFPVLIDEDFARTAGVSGYPTTLFIDRKGRIGFRSGYSGMLVEEYGWRVDALLSDEEPERGESR